MACRYVACVGVFVVAAAAASPVSAQLFTQPVTGIGTSIPDVYGDGSAVAVATTVDSVTFTRPRVIHDQGRDYFEVTGSIAGTGWGGQWQQLDGPGPVTDTTSHYTYDIPFVLRWHVLWDGTLVYYSHGRTSLALLTLAESVLGPQNEGRAQELEGTFVSDAMLTWDRRHAFFAPNVGGLRRDGTYSMHAVEGPFAGSPVAGTIDAATARDLARVAKLLLKRFTHRDVTATIGTGHSAGALIAQFLNSGQSMVLDDDRFGTRLLTGGDYNTPYDSASGRIFDGFVAFAGSEVTVNAAFPLAAPMAMIAGQAEFSGLDSVLYARRVKRAGVDLAANLRIYQVRNLPHNWAEIVLSTPNLNRMASDLFGSAPQADGDRMAPVVAAVIDRVEAWTRHGTAPPASRIEGDGQDLSGDGVPDMLVFPYADGGTTTLIPHVDNQALDVYNGFQFDTTGTPIVARYLEPLADLPRGAALSLPGVSCRVGGFVISEQFSDSRLVPFADMTAYWKNFTRYRACVAREVSELARTGLYDWRLAPNPNDLKPLFK
jgi:hypothetical protein